MSGAAVEIGNNRCSDSDGTTVRVRVIAPSSMGKPSNLEVFRRFLRDAGMTARVDDSIYRAGADPFYANTDQFRAADLVDALTDSCTVVWCARGGKGASRMIPYLEALPADRKQRIRDARKTLVGYSDATALHVYLQTVYGWQTVHGTMLEMIADGTVDRRSVDALVALVTGRSDRVRYELRLVDAGGPRDERLSLRSKVAGGNLTLVENSLGTSCCFRGDGKIVFLEDVRVQPYALERSLDHMKLAGVFDGATAVVFGSFSVEEQPAGNCNGVPSPDDHLMALVFRRFAATVLFPVFRVDGIGHSFVNNPLPLNTEATVVGPTRLDDATETSIYTLTVDNVYNTGAQSCIRPPVPLDQAA
ncbi:putative LD carboxypeptidase [Acyrthosiphon pisum]|uniref:Putative LD carboxypeptidase n=1 Tax=Acyrthosiphon pisum TaxID=7029 RepID=B9ZYY7_ACYPI|nr:putative LD carboxypeptidase [Acyrthosiphon pisum]BAH29782.1 putative LD carboxypeptidase [Acyrthosiphon pisum]|eukprot:NP_001155984.1 putative LD carboxypeptidase [Acyrthosiphon pisum]